MPNESPPPVRERGTAAARESATGQALATPGATRLSLVLASWFERVLDNPALRWALFAMAAASLLATGIFGVGRPDTGFLNGGADFEFLYVAGKLWLEGSNPYDIDAYRAAFTFRKAGPGFAFAYPPIIAPICILVGAFPHEIGEFLYQLMGLASVAAIAVGSVYLVRPPPEQKQRMLTLTTLLLLFSPFTSHVLWMGQTSLIATALVVGAYVAHARRSYVLTGILCGLALLKPQLSLLPVLWLTVTDRWNWRWWLPAAATVLVSVAVPILMCGGPLNFVADYRAAVAEYRVAMQQSVEWRHLVGLASLAAAVGVRLPLLAPVGLALAALAWFRRERLLNGGEVLSVLMLIALLFLFAHNYDLVALAPLAPVLYRRATNKPLFGLCCLASLLILYFPQRLLVPLNVPVLLRYREILLTGYLALFFWFMFRGVRRVPVRAEPERP